VSESGCTATDALDIDFGEALRQTPAAASPLQRAAAGQPHGCRRIPRACHD